MILDEIGTYLQTQGLGTLNTDLFLGFMPDSPDACTALYETVGEAPSLAFHTNPGEIVLEYPHFQVAVRSAKRDNSATFYTDARTKAQNIWKKLQGLGNVTLSGASYKYIHALQSPCFRNRDENQRVIFAANYRAAKRLSP